MKKLLLACVALVSVATLAEASVTVELDAGVLRTATGNTFTGGLLQLVAMRSTSTAFAAPTATSFVGGDTTNELVIATFTFNQGTPTPSVFVTGESDNLLVYSYENTTAQFSTTTFDPGDSLLLRWYPALTPASTAPGLGATYGQYRSSGTPDGGIAWFGPADARNLTIPNGLNFLTTTANGSNLDTAGFASNVVVAAGVPEPSSVVLLSAAAVGLFGWAKMRRRV